MTDRDHFAAAALTGLIANEGDGPSLSNTCAYAYRIADAMLRERAKNNADPIVPSRDKVSGVTSPPVSSGETINRSAESQSPDAQCGGGEPLDDTRPDTNGEATGGRGHNIPDSRTRLSEAEIDALEYVLVDGRIASMDDYGVLRSLLARVRPEWEATPKPEPPPRRCYSCHCTVDGWFFRQFCRNCYDRGVR